jgi:hypothetical protein
MNHYHWGSWYLPKFTLFSARNGKRFHKCNPVFNGNSNEFSEVGVHNIFEAGDNSLQGACFVVGSIGLKEIVVLPQFVLDFTNEEITPLN